MKKSNIFKNLIGETLLEVLIAVTALMIMGVGTSAMLIASMKTTGISRDYLIGHNLAVESIEGINNIVATNELINPDSTNVDCWKQINPDPINPNANCDSTTVIGENKNYRINQTLTDEGEITIKWVLEEETGEDLNSATSLDNPDIIDYKLNRIQFGTICVYNHSRLIPCTVEGKDFYRQVSIHEVDNIEHKIEAEIIMKWQEGGKISTYNTGIIKIM